MSITQELTLLFFGVLALAVALDVILSRRK
jgi:predicted nucleic acid-binding Zn ribbon protein